MKTRARQTLVYVDLTGGSSVASVVAAAGEHVDSVYANSSVLARETFAVIDVHLTGFPLVARYTEASEVVDSANPIDAGGTILTRSRRTFVNVNFAVCAVKAKETVAAVVVHQVRAAPMQAWVGETLVKLVVAEGSRVAGPAEALEASREVATDSVVADVGRGARVQQTLIHILGTGGSSVTIRAGALESGTRLV